MTRAALLFALLTAACASAQPAPISYGGGGDSAAGSERAREPLITPSGNGRARIEYRGAVVEPPAPPPAAPMETAEASAAPTPQEAPDWAEGEGTPLSAYALQPGEVQPFDPARLPRTHRVGENESLYDIATRYQVPLRALIDENGLEPPYSLSAGRELRLPPPRFHTVERNESFEDVARRYNVDLRSLALLNRMSPPFQVRRGDRIALPAMARALPAAQSETPAPAPTIASNARFAMPLRGAVVARFGAQPGGERLDGVEIAGEEGDAVLAAGDGDVVYAGDDLPAYGTLVLIRHEDNYVTAYGFNRRALVREGQRVRTGQPIAELGERAGGRPRLLFQVRQGSAAIDPAPLLGLQN
ncbi:MAG TPA: peptidoglycan DD-metalloendopeptidase family protein [Vitreimonas sp.]|uniref:peptidoglycan DD-metalloendopeptidase family protein n=1 Tax=Vitreimonas sp. TaxID=3069702 RepID=UPI002D729AFE|nr:peptidoglycan DD-metalloendopeptidase family protein [Vitreimonas sp.]HYD88389.1 peptidoglycan DD-metalloendopeptidase family protein [Vitreimonas sp.]